MPHGMGTFPRVSRKVTGAYGRLEFRKAGRGRGFWRVVPTTNYADALSVPVARNKLPGRVSA